MAEQLGEVALKVSAETSDYDRKIQQTRQTAIEAGRAIEQALSKPIGRPYGPIPPPPPPLKLPQADTSALEAGLQRAREQAQATAQATEQAFTRTGKALQTAADGTQYFIDAAGRARSATGQLMTLAQQQAAGITQATQAAATGPASSIRSIEALQQRLQSLRASYETVQIGSRGFQQLQREIQRTEQELQRATRSAGEFGSNLLGALGVGVGLGAGAAVGGFLRGSVNEVVQLETVTRKLSNTLGPEGAAGALAFVKGLSDETGLSFKTLADGFSRFTAAATAANVPLQTQRELFAAVSRSGQALGLSNDEINGSLLALQQVASKGTVAMEELRGQLGERLPIALSATARGLGVTQAELIKLVESGKLTASQFFPALTKGLNELTAGSGGVETTAQRFGKLQNAWENLQVGFGQNLLPGVAASVTTLTEALGGLAAVLELLSKLPGGPGVLSNIFSTSLVLGPGVALQGIRDQLPKESGPTFFGPFRTKEQEADARARRQRQLDDEARITTEKQKQLDIDLRKEQSALQLANAEARLQAVRLTPGLDEAGRTRLQNELSLNEKIRDVEAVRLALQRELDKPKGAGDGKPTAQGAPTQNQKTIDELQGRLEAGRVDVATLRLQNEQADAAALRTQQERLRGQQLEAAAAAAKLNTTKQQTELERQALAAGVEVSRTAQLRLQQEESIGAALRQQQAAQDALRKEQAKPREQQDRVVLDDLFARVARANEGVRQAYADAGLSLVQNARSAADALKSAQQGFNSAARGGFNLLTPQLQAQQIAAARANVQTAVDRGLIRTGIDISTPDKLFQVAGFAEQIVPAQKQLEQAIKENAAATSRLADKSWEVFVSVPDQPAFVPLPNT